MLTVYINFHLAFEFITFEIIITFLGTLFKVFMLDVEKCYGGARGVKVITHTYRSYSLAYIGGLCRY